MRFSVQGRLVPTIKRVNVVKAELICGQKTSFSSDEAKKSGVDGSV